MQTPSCDGVQSVGSVCGGGETDVGDGGFDGGSKGTIPTGTMLQFLWFLGHIRWIFSFFSSSMSLQGDDETESALVVRPTSTGLKRSLVVIRGTYS